MSLARIKGGTPLTREVAPRAQEGDKLSKSPEARIKALEDMILARLDDDKAQDVVSIDLKG